MSFPDITHEIAAGLRGAADQIVDVFKGSARSNAFFTGPTIPFPIDEHNRRRDLAGLSFGALRLSQNLQAVSIFSSPLAASIAFAPALLHTKEYRLYSIGLNPEKVLARGEWHRLVTSQLINATFVQLLENANDLYESGSWLEKRWGWQGLLGAVGAVSSLAPALYVALTAFAHRLAPSSALAQQYLSAYFVSPSMIALGISVLSGYDKDIYASSRNAGRNDIDQIWSARYVWGARLLMTTFLAPSINVANNMEANICGILAGLISVYAFGVGNTRWRKRGGLGLNDVAIQGALLGFLGIASYLVTMQSAIAQKSFSGASLKAQAPRARQNVSTVIVANGKKVDISKQGLNSVENKTVKLNLMGKSETMKQKDWVDPSGRKGKGYGVYKFESKYGANVDGYSPIYTPDAWSESGESYKLGTKGLVAWAGLLVVLLGVGVSLIVSTSAIGQ